MWKAALVVASALITIGIYIATVRSNTNRIEKVEVKANDTEKVVVGMQKDIEYIKIMQQQILDEVLK